MSTIARYWKFAGKFHEERAVIIIIIVLILIIATVVVIAAVTEVNLKIKKMINKID